MSRETSRLRIDTDTLRIEFDVFESGVTVSNLIHKGEGATFCLQSTPNRESEWWELVFHNELGERLVVDSTDGADFTYDVDESRKSTSVHFRWQDIPLVFRNDDHRGHVDVTVDARVPSDEAIAYWRASVDVRATDVTLWNFVFPKFHDIHRVGADRKNDYLLTPEGWGTYINNPLEEDRLSIWSHENYPSGTWPMQFFSYENDSLGLYVGMHDPAARTKGMDLDVDGESRSISFQTTHYPDDMGRDQDGFELDYEIATALYEGGWYDAAQLYREWATTEPSWTACEPVATRDTIPNWFKELSVWWAPGFAEVVPWSDESAVGFEETTSLLLALHDRFSVPTGVHWYGWHKNAFDTDHPDHFPPQPGFEDAVEAVQNEDVHVFPYTTVRSWDPNSGMWETNDLEAGAAKRSSPRLEPRARIKYVEAFTNPQLLSPMCASTEQLKRTTEEVIRELVDGIGVRGVYLDQMAASDPPLCFDPEHDHSLGGGSYAVTGYQTLLDDLTTVDDEVGDSEAERKGATADNGEDLSPAFTTEANAEPYMCGVSGYLLWHSARSDLVPLFPTVYGEYSFTFGREFFEHDLGDDPTAFTSKLAQLFTFGAQLGWFSRPVGRTLLEPEYEDAAEYLAELAEAVHAGWEYVTAGRRLRAVRHLSRLPSDELEWDMQYRGVWEVELPYLLTSVWTSPSEDGIAVSITNWGEETQSAVFELTPEHLSHVDGERYEMNRLTSGESAIEVRFEGESAEVTVTVPPRSTDIVAIVPF